MAQSPRVIVADNHVNVLPAVRPVNELKEVVELESVTLNTFKPTPKQVTVSDLSLKSNSYIPTAQQLKKATKIQKRLNKKAKSNGSISQPVAIILAALLGTLGIHRFYLGYTGIGIIQLLTFGGLGIWSLIDLIRIILGDLKPNGGEYDETL
jgi:TM2 domain-containing membrane protein YozV